MPSFGEDDPEFAAIIFADLTAKHPIRRSRVVPDLVFSVLAPTGWPVAPFLAKWRFGERAISGLIKHRVYMLYDVHIWTYGDALRYNTWPKTDEASI